MGAVFKVDLGWLLLSVSPSQPINPGTTFENDLCFRKNNIGKKEMDRKIMDVLADAQEDRLRVSLVCTPII